MNSLQTIWDEPFPFVTATKSLQLTHSTIATQKKNKCSLHFPLWFSEIIAENTWVLAQTRGGAVLPDFWKRQYHLPFFSLLFSPLKGNYSPVAIRQSPTASLVEVGEVTLADVRVLNRFRLLFTAEARERCSGGDASLCSPISQALASSLALLSGDAKPWSHHCHGQDGKALDNVVASTQPPKEGWAELLWLWIASAPRRTLELPHILAGAWGIGRAFLPNCIYRHAVVNALCSDAKLADEVGSVSSNFSHFR